MEREKENGGEAQGEGGCWRVLHYISLWVLVEIGGLSGAVREVARLKTGNRCERFY